MSAETPAIGDARARLRDGWKGTNGLCRGTNVQPKAWCRESGGSWEGLNSSSSRRRRRMRRRREKRRAGEARSRQSIGYRINETSSLPSRREEEIG